MKSAGKMGGGFPNCFSLQILSEHFHWWVRFFFGLYLFSWFISSSSILTGWCNSFSEIFSSLSWLLSSWSILMILPGGWVGSRNIHFRIKRVTDVGYFKDCGIFETFIAVRLVCLANYFPLQTLCLRLNITRIEKISLQPAIIKKSVTQNKTVGRRHWYRKT